MNKLKFLTIASITLLLINLLLVGFIVLRPLWKKKNIGPKDYIVKRLNLNEAQIKQYDVWIEAHQNKRKELNKKIIKNRQLLYQQLVTNTPEIPNRFIDELGMIQQELEILHWKHFQDLKLLCTEDQLKEFNLLVDELAILFASKKRHRQKPS